MQKRGQERVYRLKRRIWVVSPLVYLMAAAMLIMSLISHRYNRILFTIELTVSILSFTGVMVSDLNLRRSLRDSMRRTRQVLQGEDQAHLDGFPLPIVVVGTQGEMLWGNTAFREKLVSKGNFLGQSVLQITYPKTLRQIVERRETDIHYAQRSYTVYGIKSGENHILYFVDNTHYKQIEREHRDHKPIICMAVFDNREEIARDSQIGEEARITADVESVLREWTIKEMGGFLQKLRNDRFLIVTDELHVNKARQNRFPVLDQVRELKSDSKMSATISIGIGGDAVSASDSERRARQALDMALGRGGDQVALMQKGDAFKFFGGLSKGVEKRDKVRTRVIAASIADQVKASDHVFVMGHKNSDMDSVGACIGMWAVIRKGLEKPAYVVIQQEQSLAGQLVHSVSESYPQETIFIDPGTALQHLTDDTLVIVVDTHVPYLVESAELLSRCSRLIVIDHHRLMVNRIQKARIFFHEPYASSASEMVTEIVQYIKGSAIERIEANALLSGISLDTKNFVLKTGVRTFEASAFLKARGADTVEVKRLFADSLETYRSKSQLVQNAEIYKACAISMSRWGDNADLRISAAQAADELLSITGVRASFVLYRNQSCVNISARSLGDVNVQVVLEALGGGGHYTMAGAQIKDSSLAEVRKSLLLVLDETLDTAS